MLLESEDVEWIGEEELDGATVNHYKGTLAIEEVYELQAPSTAERGGARSLLDLLSEQAPSSTSWRSGSTRTTSRSR